MRGPVILTCTRTLANVLWQRWRVCAGANVTSLSAAVLLLHSLSNGLSTRSPCKRKERRVIATFAIQAYRAPFSRLLSHPLDSVCVRSDGCSVVTFLFFFFLIIISLFFFIFPFFSRYCFLLLSLCEYIEDFSTACFSSFIYFKVFRVDCRLRLCCLCVCGQRMVPLSAPSAPVLAVLLRVSFFRLSADAWPLKKNTHQQKEE